MPAALLLTVVLGALMSGQAFAAASNPTDRQLTAARSAQAAAAADVARIAGLLTSAESSVERANGMAEAANNDYLVAQGRLEDTQRTAASTAANLRRATDAVTVAQANVGKLSRAAYMRGSELTSVAALLNAKGPSELLDQAATLRMLGDQRTTILDQVGVARAQQANADSQARAAVAAQNTALAKTAQTKAAADARVGAFQAALQTATAQKAAYSRQLQDAQVRLLALQGQRNAYQAWKNQQARQKAAAAAKAAADAKAAAQAAQQVRESASSGDGTTAPVSSSAGVAPTSGIFTTCYEMRWGSMHYGIDIAAPIGTPIYAPAAGVVMRAGPATGFGLAVYIQHDDGSVTVYGHINAYFVHVGQRVSAGDQIAEVGNRGESTGPHLHFQVNTDGMYAGSVDPIPWLAARGVYMGGRCR